jgi:hypothetical protein
VTKSSTFDDSTSTTIKAKASPTSFSFGGRLGMSSLKCHGLTVLWVTSAAAIVAPLLLAWQPNLPPLAWLCHAGATAHAVAADPIVPPPRVLPG